MQVETRQTDGDRSAGPLPVKERPARGVKPFRFTVDRVIRFLLGAGAVAVAVWLLWYFSGLVIYLGIGLLVAYLMRPVADRIQGIGLGRIPAILLTFLLFFGGVAVLLTFLVPFVARQVTELSQQIAIESAVQVTGFVPGSAQGQATLDPGDIIVAAEGQAISDLEQLTGVLRGKEAGDRITLVVEDSEGERRHVVIQLGEPGEISDGPETLDGQVFGSLGLVARTVVFSDVLTAIEEEVGRFIPVRQGVLMDAVTGVFETLFQEGRLTRLMGSVVGFFTDVFYAVIIIPFVAFFVLKDGSSIRHSLLQLVPNRYFEITLVLIEKIETNIGRYFRGLLLQSLSIATLATLLLTFVGLEAALAVGIFAGLANTIPYFGPLMGFVAGTLVGIAQTGDFALLPGVLLAMGLTQLADNLLFQPLIFSRVARAHPLVILFVVLIGAQLGGIVGMLVAIPVMTIIRVTVQQILWSLRNYRILQAT